MDFMEAPSGSNIAVIDFLQHLSRAAPSAPPNAGSCVITGGLSEEVCLPGVEIPPLGLIGLPLIQLQADVLKKLHPASGHSQSSSLRSPMDKPEQHYWNRSESLDSGAAVASGGNGVWEWDRSQLEMRNPKWNQWLCRTMAELSLQFGYAADEVAPCLSKLVMCDEGTLFPVPMDDGVEPSSGPPGRRANGKEQHHMKIGTLVVILPAEQEGGRMVVSNSSNGRQESFEFSGTEATFGLSYVAFSNGCQCRIDTLTRGRMVCLIYSIFNLGSTGGATTTVPMPLGGGGGSGGGGGQRVIDQIYGCVKMWTEEEGLREASRRLQGVCQNYGWAQMEGVLKDSMDSDASSVVVPLFHVLQCLAYTESGGEVIEDQDRLQTVSSLSDHFLKVLSAHVSGGQTTSLDAAFLAGLLKIFYSANSVVALESALMHIIWNLNVYDVPSMVIPAVKELFQWLGKDRASVCPVFLGLSAHCGDFLQGRMTTTPVSTPVNWTQHYSIPCPCKECATLQSFLQHPSQKEFRLKVNHSKRLHVENQLLLSKCNVKCFTEKTGSPQTLVCVKTRESYEYNQSQRSKDSQCLKELQDMVRFASSPLEDPPPPLPPLSSAPPSPQFFFSTMTPPASPQFLGIPSLPPSPSIQQSRGPQSQARPPIHHIFEQSNQLTPQDKNLILQFIGGNRKNPTPEQGPIHQILLHAEMKEDPLTGTQFAEQLIVELNYETRTLKKVKKSKRPKPQLLQQFHQYQQVNQMQTGPLSSFAEPRTKRPREL